MSPGFIELAIGSSALGLLHGLAPGHGWAIAASYAVTKPNKLLYGATTALILGIGHLVSSVAMVLAYFWTISYFDLTELEWMHYVAGALLILLGIYQYFNPHLHEHSPSDASDHDHHHDADHDPATHEHRHSWRTRLRKVIPGVDAHEHTHEDPDTHLDRGLYGMVVFAFALGFTHNEEFDIIAICTGTTHCLELMLVYAGAVVVSLVAVTVLLVAGFERYEDRLEQYAPYLPAVTASILILMGIGFILGIF